MQGETMQWPSALGRPLMQLKLLLLDIKLKQERRLPRLQYQRMRRAKQ